MCGLKQKAESSGTVMLSFFHSLALFSFCPSVREQDSTDNSDVTINNNKKTQEIITQEIFMQFNNFTQSISLATVIIYSIVFTVFIHFLIYINIVLVIGISFVKYLYLTLMFISILLI